MSTRESTVGGMPISRLREILQRADDESLAKFLSSFSMGWAAEQFIAGMTNVPNERVIFIATLAEKYPEDWAKALELVQQATK